MPERSGAGFQPANPSRSGIPARHLAVAIAALLIAARLASAPTAQEDAGVIGATEPITIIYTTETTGNLEPCG